MRERTRPRDKSMCTCAIRDRLQERNLRTSWLAHLGGTEPLPHALWTVA